MKKVIIEFSTRLDADIFASEYAKEHLKGHMVDKNSVTVYDVTESSKEWIDTYVENLNDLNNNKCSWVGGYSSTYITNCGEAYTLTTDKSAVLVCPTCKKPIVYK